MPSQFVDNFTYPLKAPSPSLPFSALEISTDGSTGKPNIPSSAVKQDLHTLLSSFSHSQLLTGQQLSNAVDVLARLEAQKEFTTKASDAEEDALRNAVIGKVVIGLYAEAVDIYLAQATEVEAEADWWKDIECSSLNVAWYLLQSMLNFRCPWDIF